MTSAAKALASYVKKDYCLAILDIQLSDMDGMELLRTMRQAKATPILVLTEPLHSKYIVAFFHDGADAYIEKPVNLQICRAQANVLIQRYLDSDIVTKEHRPITFGTELIISPRFRQVIVDGKPLTLTRKEFDVLHCLASYPGQVFSLEHLYTHVWNDESASSGEETVRVHIQSLRRKLAAAGKDFIQNSWGVGYKFVLPETQ